MRRQPHKIRKIAQKTSYRHLHPHLSFQLLWTTLKTRISVFPGQRNFMESSGAAAPAHLYALLRSRPDRPPRNLHLIGDLMTMNEPNPLMETPTNQSFRPQPQAPTGIADLVYFSDLQLQPVQWLWQDRLASGTLAMISGVPGSGKTWIALAIAAALSRGRVPDTGETCEPCNVMYASMEHGSSEIIHPRFIGLQGDPARFVVLRGAVSETAPSLNLRDTAVLEDALQRTHARLLTLDSFHSFS